MKVIWIVLVIILGILGSFVWRGNNEAEVGSQISETTNPRMELEKSRDYEVREFAQGLEVPWSILLTSSERMIVSERPGRIREIVNGQLNPQPLYVFSDISTVSEEGLMGMVLHPDYATNKQLYVCYAYPSNDGIKDRVAVLEDLGNEMRLVGVILDNIPAARFHAGCGLGIGPDDKLYVSTGDALDKNDAQKLDSLAGKILRLNLDGSVPEDNPFGGNLVYSYGHRNPQGFDWHPISQELWASEHGPSLIDGPAGGDEINLVTRGGNYGWPLVSHEKSQSGLIDPKIIYTPAIAPSSGKFYKSNKLADFENNFLYGGLVGNGLFRAKIDKDGNVEGHEKVDLIGLNPGRVRAITVGMDGYIYFGSSNRDGRGKIQDGDDKIWRIVPKGE